MIHYHCADIRPVEKFMGLAGRHLLVSFAYPSRVRLAHEVGQSVLLDNGAFSVWKAGRSIDWRAFYEWADEWLACPTTWAIIPDVIDAGPAAQDQLLAEWPLGERGAPVWHTDEPVDRLLRLADAWPRVCIGSSGAHPINATAWRRVMDAAFDALAQRHRRLPWMHGLRMQAVGTAYPFGSVDSADIARNHNRPQNTVAKMADRWDRQQPAIGWHPRPHQRELVL